MGFYDLSRDNKKIVHCCFRIKITHEHQTDSAVWIVALFVYLRDTSTNQEKQQFSKTQIRNVLLYRLWLALTFVEKMIGLVWTHPLHKMFALIGTALNFISLLCGLESLLVINWFSNNAPSILKEYYLTNMDVDCTQDVCLPGKKIATWQKVAVNLLFVGTVNCSVTLAILMIIFWPLAMVKNMVINHLLISCRVLSLIGGAFKYIGVFIYIYHIHKISRSHAWMEYPNSVKLESLPLAVMLISSLTEILSFMFMLIATDQKPRTGGLTHRQRLDIDAVIAKTPEEVRASRRVSYQPVTRDSHMQILSLVQIKRQSIDQIKSDEIGSYV